MNIDRMYQQAMRAILPKSDMKLGKTAREWSKVWGITYAVARRQISEFVGAGLMIEDKDWRPFKTAMRKECVYRWKKGGKRE